MQIKYWILAARPKTLPAAACPVIAGTVLAHMDGSLKELPALICLAFAFLVQIGTNFANDYFDFKKGADTDKRKGPARAVASGWILPESMLRATVFTLALAFVVGLCLIPFGGWNLLFLGLLSIACAVLYTGGPYPFAYKGLGDVFVVLFFGLIAVAFTYFVQAQAFTKEAWLVGLALGLLINNLLVINNMRDIEEDRASNKMTLPARFGRSFAVFQYQAAITAACLTMLILAFVTDRYAYFVPAMAYPVGRYLAIILLRAETPTQYNRLLAMTSAFLMLFTALFLGGGIWLT